MPTVPYSATWSHRYGRLSRRIRAGRSRTWLVNELPVRSSGRGGRRPCCSGGRSRCARRVRGGHGGRRDPAAGGATGALALLVPPSLPATKPRRLVMTPDGRSLFVTAGRSGEGRVLQYDVSPTGLASPKEPPEIAAGELPVAMAADQRAEGSLRGRQGRAASCSSRSVPAGDCTRWAPRPDGRSGGGGSLALTASTHTSSSAAGSSASRGGSRRPPGPRQPHLREHGRRPHRRRSDPRRGSPVRGQP